MMTYNLLDYYTDPYYNAYYIAEKIYGTATAQMAEKIYKLETANYKSTQFLNSYSAGQVAFGTAYPWGWTTMKPFWDKKLIVKPNKTWSTTVNGQPFSYVVYPTFRAALISLCQRLSQIGNDPVKYNGGADPTYATKVGNMTNDYVTS